jgi:hypothetical protein
MLETIEEEAVLGEFPLRPRGGELPGELPECFLGFLAFLRSSNAKFGVGSGIIVGRGWMGLRLIADGPSEPPGMI